MMIRILDGAMTKWVTPTEFLDILAKNDSRLVLRQTDLPSKEVQEGSDSSLALPKTDREIDILLSSLDIDRHGKVVGLLLTEGYATTSESQLLLPRLAELAAAYDKFRRMLRHTLKNRRDRLDGVPV